jgi:site-specific DNA recombinase
MARRPLQNDRPIQRLRIGIYLRVSTDDQAEHGYGGDVQLQQCKAMAMVKSGDVVGIYDDAGISGTKGESKRPELARMMKDIRAGRLDMVIIAALDRLGRNTRIILDLVERMSDEGVEIVSCRESLDTSTPTGKFVLTMFAALAQLDRDNIVKRTTEGRDARGKHDGEKGGNVPLGYFRIDQGVVIEPRQAALVRRIFVMRGEPSSLGDIAAVLNSEGVPTPRNGLAWYSSTVREVLTHEATYRGGKRGESEASWPVLLDGIAHLPRDKRRRRGPSKPKEPVE